MRSLGRDVLGAGGPIAGSLAGSGPSVTVTAPSGTVSTGGPELTVEWDYDGGLYAQASWLVEILSGSAVLYTSGVRSGTDTSHTVDVDAHGLPHDGDSLTARVTVTRVGAAHQSHTASDDETFSLEWGDPVLAITSPADGASTGDVTPTVTWTFSETQSAYRVQVRFHGSDGVLFDSGWTTGSDLSYELPYSLQNLSAYDITVQGKNDHGMRSPADSVAVFTVFDDPTQYAENPGVGRIYEVALNGRGLMLADNPPQGITHRDGTVDLTPPRLATSDTPFDQAIDRHAFSTADDWSAGAGQRWRDREGSTSAAFWDSEGVDPFSGPGSLSLLNTAEVIVESGLAAPWKVAVADGKLFWTTASGLAYTDGETPGTVAAGAVTDLTSDGVEWYAASGSAILRGSTTSSTWSALDAVGVRWAAGRVCAAVKAGSSSTPNRFTTLNDAGAEEVEDGHLTLPEGHTVVLGGATAGAFYFGAHGGQSGEIWQWPLGLDQDGGFFAPYVAWQMPEGLYPSAVGVAGGDVWVRAVRADGEDAGEVFIYRGVPGGGLTPVLVAELGVTSAEGTFLEHDDKVLFSWEDTDGEAAWGAVNLVSGGYARWWRTGAAGAITGAVVWNGEPVWTVSGDDVYGVDRDSFEAEGWVVQSTADGGSMLPKVWDRVRITHQPLGVDESIAVSYSTDLGNVFLDAGANSGLGSTTRTFDVGVQSGALAFKVTLEGPGTSTPSLAAMFPMYHALGLADALIQLPVLCADTLTSVTGSPLAESKPGLAMELRAFLKGLTQQRVLLQDIDWPISRRAEVWEVVGVEWQGLGGVYDEALGYKSWMGVSTVTLRKLGAGG